MLPVCPVLEEMARRALALLAPGELARAAEGEALERLAAVLSTHPLTVELPPARVELPPNERDGKMTSWGTLTDYTKGTEIRPATSAEWLTSAIAAEAGDGTGAFILDGTADLDVFVSGGPDSSVSDIDIDELEQEARIAGDSGQVALCEGAREGDPDDRAKCVEVILRNRVESLA